MIRMKLIILTAIVVATANCERFLYENYTLFNIEPQTEYHYKLLKELHDSNVYDFWNVPSKNIGSVNVVSSPEFKQNLLQLLEINGIKTRITMENIQEAIDAQQPLRHKRDVSRSLFWTNYQLLEDIYNWFDELGAAHSNVVTVIVVGESFEGRQIKGVKISRTSGRRAFFLEGGMVGADWLSPVTLTYMVRELVENEESEIRQASVDYDWYIVPVTNPDGYEFSQDSVRLWTKNRRPLGGNNFGVDMTKNWNSYWSVTGASFDAASDTYAGHGPFSEIETRTLSAYIATVPRLYGFLSFRATMQRLVIPFAHTSEHIYNYYDMILVGRRAMGSMAVRYGTTYEVGNSIEVLDGATGSAADWVKHRFNPPIAATYQLRDRVNGYLLPVSQIQPNCEEVFDSVIAIVREGREANFGN